MGSATGATVRPPRHAHQINAQQDEWRTDLPPDMSGLLFVASRHVAGQIFIEPPIACAYSPSARHSWGSRRRVASR